MPVSCQKSNEKKYNGTTENSTTNIGSSKAEEDLIYSASFVPGKRLANIVLGKNAQSVMDSLGAPDSGDAAMGKSVSNWNIPGEIGAVLSLFSSIKMGVEDFPRIQSVRTTSVKYESKNGLGVGSTLNEIKKIYDVQKVGTFQENDNRYILFDTNVGVGFEIGPDNKCHGILIHRPGQKAGEKYLPFYEYFEHAKVDPDTTNQS